MKLLNATIKKIAASDTAARAQARAHLEQLTMPHWALGRLMDLAEDLAGMTASARPSVARKTIVVMAGDHGVVAEGVSKYPAEVTTQMIHNFVNGGAGINALARLAGARVVVVDMGVAGDLSALVNAGKIISKRVAAGAKNFAHGDAMTRKEAIRSIEAGIEVAQELSGSTDIFGTGDMGIGNTTPSSAIIAVLANAPMERVVGYGTGISEAQWKRKLSLLYRAQSARNPNVTDAIDVLTKVGGFEIGGIAGLILGAAAQRKPILVDGFISAAGALIAQSLAPLSVEYMIAAHRGSEPGHSIALMQLEKKPLLSLDLRLGEGTGCALAMNLVDAAIRVLTEVATFKEAAVSEAHKCDCHK